MGIKKIRILLAFAFLSTVIALTACGGGNSYGDNGGAQEASTPAPASLSSNETRQLTAAGLVQAFIDAGLPLIHVIEYTSATDPNSLLGRPGEYTEKINWYDERYFEDWMDDESPNLTVEVFRNREEMERRRDHIQSLQEAMPILGGQYFFYSDTMLLRLSFDLTPESAAQYEEVFRAFLVGETVVFDINPIPPPLPPQGTGQDIAVSFSDTEITNDFFSISLSFSEDISHSTSDALLWLYFSDASFPMGMFTMEGTTDVGPTENDVNTFLNNVGNQLQYDGGSVSWSDIERLTVNNLQIFLSETKIDGEVFNVDETLNVTAGIFVAGRDIFSIMFVATPQMYNVYLPHFRTILNTIETIEVPTIEQTPEPTPEPTPAPAPTSQILVGTWLWMGLPYYVFEENGRGTISGMDMRWSTRSGILSICTTPAICGNTCLAPTEWRYTLDGNQLTLISTLTPDLTFTYTRR